MNPYQPFLFIVPAIISILASISKTKKQKISIR